MSQFSIIPFPHVKGNHNARMFLRVISLEFPNLYHWHLYLPFGLFTLYWDIMLSKSVDREGKMRAGLASSCNANRSLSLLLTLWKCQAMIYNSLSLQGLCKEIIQMMWSTLGQCNARLGIAGMFWSLCALSRISEHKIQWRKG
jgi:hypothetical protein